MASGIRKKALRKLKDEALKNEIRLQEPGFTLSTKVPLPLWFFDGLELFHFRLTHQFLALFSGALTFCQLL